MSLYNLTKTTGDTGYGSELYTFLTFLNDYAVTADSVNDLTQKTLINPVFTGAITGVYTLGGTPTITSPTINAGTFTGALTITGNPTFSGTVVLPTITGDLALTGGLTAGGNLTISGTAVNTGFADLITIDQNSATSGYYSGLAFRQNSSNVGARIISGNPLGYQGYLSFQINENVSTPTETTIEKMRIGVNGMAVVLPTYADNATAISGGLVATYMYKTATGELRIVV